MSEPYRPFHDDPDYYEGRAFGLRSVHDAGLESALAIVAELLPDRDPSRPLAEGEARLVLARQHGSQDWAALMARVASLDGDPFRKAYLCVEHDDAAGLAALLDREPWLVEARGTNGNDLLGMAGSIEVTRLLLSRGADPARANDKGWTPLHQAGYGNRADAARLLLDAGAPVEASGHGEGGTPLVAALFWGHREVAEVLAEHGTPPGNLRVAAGLGHLEAIAELAPGGGAVTEEGRAARGFYRPHSGFPPWRPGGSAREALDEALSWAARSDRAEALSLLAERGAAVDADVYRGTALTWAAACGRVAAIERLVALGAEVDRRGTFGGPDHGEGVTALHSPRRPATPRRRARCSPLAPTRRSRTAFTAVARRAGQRWAAIRSWPPSSPGQAAGREGRRGTRLGAAQGAMTEWAIRRTVRGRSSGMDDVARATVTVPRPPERAFVAFVDGLGDWWPPEYTWAQQKLDAIGIEPREGGLCSERGPHGFRLDWGRVIAWEPPSRLVFTWQMGPTRVPEPDPDRAGEVEVRFEPDGGDGTRVELVHRGFERHGEGAADYRAAMDSEQGWDFILGRFAEHASR